MNKIKLGLCQMNVIDNKEKNIDKAKEMITNANKQGADIAILPEMFNCPYENDKFIEFAENRKNSKTMNEISKIADNNNIYVLAGSIPEEENSKIFNTSFFFDNNGKIIGSHRKMHLFDIDIPEKIYFKESDTIRPGNTVNIITTPFGKIGIGICYDIRFPELARILTLKNADILIYPGSFNLTTGPIHWKLLFKARAIDNQIFTVGVSPARNMNLNYHAYGHSIAVNPWGEVIGECKEKEELLIVELDLDKIKESRDELPVLKNRRTDIYDVNYKQNE